MAVPPQNSQQASVVSPYLTVRDVDAAVKFYQKAFQFIPTQITPGKDGTSEHAEMEYKNHLIMAGKEGAWESLLKSPRTSGVDSPITLCVYCDDVDQFYTAALSNGAKSISAPEDMFWGDRMCRLQDPDNYTWCFLTPVA